MKLDDYPHAREKLEESVAISIAVFGYKHLQVAIGLSNLGVTLSYLGDIDQAREKLEESVAIGIAVLGPEHPVTIGLSKTYREFLARFVNRKAS